MFSPDKKGLVKKIGYTVANSALALTLAAGCGSVKPNERSLRNPGIAVSGTSMGPDCSNAGLLPVPYTFRRETPEGTIVYYGVKGPSLNPNNSEGRLIPNGFVVVQLDPRLDDFEPAKRRFDIGTNTDLMTEISKTGSTVDIAGRADFALPSTPSLVSASWATRFEIPAEIQKNLRSLCPTITIRIDNGKVDPIKGTTFEYVNPKVQKKA